MLCAALPEDESTRLAAVHALGVLDTPADVEFDALAQVASSVCQAPIALICLVDAQRNWFKSRVGLNVAQTPRDTSLCAHAILGDGLFEVPDAALDARFADNPLVVGAPFVRAYIGAPLVLRDGHRVGSLCVIDQVPRQWSDAQRAALLSLALAAAKMLDGRRALREAQQASAALVVSEADMRLLCESLPLGVFRTDAQGRCTYTNAAGQAIFGLSRDKSLGLGWWRAVHPDDRDTMNAVQDLAMDWSTPFDGEFRIMRSDGEVRHAHMRSRPTYDAEGRITGHVGSVEDVTLRWRADRALRRSQDFLDRTGRVAGVGGWEVDLTDHTVTWSDETFRIHGMPKDRVPTLDQVVAFYAAEAQPVIRAAAERAAKDGTGWDLELPGVRADGQRVWVRSMASVEYANGKPERVVGACQDITQRVEEQLALKRAHERMTLATDSGGIGIWEWDCDTDVLTWDAWMHRLYGKPAGSVVGNLDHWLASLHPDDQALAQADLQAAVDGRQIFDSEFRIVRPDGGLRHIRAAARIMRDDTGRANRVIGVNWDITELRELTAQYAQQHLLLQVTLKSIGDAVITTDAAGRVSWLNPVAERLTGWTSAQAQQQPLDAVFRIVHETTRTPIDNPVIACLSIGSPEATSPHAALLARDGREYGIEDSAAPIRDDHGALLGAVLVFRDVTEQRRLSGEMRYRATHDALTGLVNRAEFEARLLRVLDRAHREPSEHALLYIDLDQFKLLNDACGHSVGDQLLQQVSRLLGDSARAQDTLARLGGDEFAMILEHCSADQAQRVAQQICERMEDFRFSHDSRRFRIGASIGLVPVDSRWQTTAAILQAADTSCYAAKEAGRNRVHTWFDTDLAMRARHGEMQWASRIEQALDDNRFVLYAQRIEPLQQPSRGLRAEILLRMLGSDGSLVPPGAFLPAAERFHLASRVDRWVLRHVIDWMQATPTLDHVQSLSVNLSGQSIGDRAFHRWAIEVLREAGATLCRLLCLEITETAAVTNMADAALFVDQVRGLGVQVALDDFGAGASSFGYLKNLPVDYLKIDGQFITDLIEDPLDEAAVRCFADVARTVGVKTVAEFVDRADVRERLRALGIDFAQGFLVHRPAPIEEVITPTVSVH